jgi:serine/threonine protein kinase
MHRDIKPHNIIVTQSDFAYLVDFGIAETRGDTPYINLFRVVLHRAENRGQLRANTDIDLLAGSFSALAFERIVGYGLAIDDAYVARVVNGLLMPACTLHAD